MTIEETAGQRRPSHIIRRLALTKRREHGLASILSSSWAIRGLVAFGVGIVLALCPPQPASAQQAATVSTEQLYVRRGPGGEFPPFATLGRGDRVEVHEVRGEWARIVTGNGQTGYVRSDFLALRDKEKASTDAAATPTAAEASSSPARPTRSPKPTRTASSTRKPRATTTPTPLRPTPTASPKATATRSEIVGDVVTTRIVATATSTWTPEVLPAATNTSATFPIATPDTSLLEKLRVEVARLTLAVEELRRRMDSQPSIEGPLPVGDGSNQGGPSGWSMAFAFGVIGALVGWILGASVGRRQERSQRSRIRF